MEEVVERQNDPCSLAEELIRQELGPGGGGSISGREAWPYPPLGHQPAREFIFLLALPFPLARGLL
ncbi:MAG: hypothetical protein JRC92_03525 [Deltaproteobacteria bacterium]|nr:hypothetical protein [Deltaproteobacteria bacterium]